MTQRVGGVPHAVAVPGHSSRSQYGTFAQFPQRDEAEMSNTNEAGWSNSEPVEGAPQDVHHEVAPPEQPEPGFSNDLAVTEAAEPEGERPAKKTAARRRADAK